MSSKNPEAGASRPLRSEESNEPAERTAERTGTQEVQTGWQKYLDVLMVWIVFTIFVLFRATDRVFYKRIANALQTPVYTLMYTNVLWPVAIQILTGFMICGYICLQRFVYGDYTYDAKFFLPGNPKASSLGAVPMMQLALFSIGDQMNAAVSSPPSPFVTMAVQSVMSNMIVVYTAIFACIWLRTKFVWTHYAGMALVIVSVLVQFIPKLVASDCSRTPDPSLPGNISPFENGDCFASYKSSTGEYIGMTSMTMIVWYLMFAVSFVPAGAGNVYKQKVLQMRDVDVWYATFWSGWWQVVWGFACIPLMWVPLPGQPRVYPQHFFTDLADTCLCILGETPRGAADATCHSDAGAQPWVYVCAYFGFNLSFNICLLYLTKKMSAAWAQIATVLCLNLCSFFSQFKFMMGDGAEIMTWSDWVGLVVASVALFVYNWYEEQTPNLVIGGDEKETPSSFVVADGPASGPAALLSFSSRHSRQQ